MPKLKNILDIWNIDYKVLTIKYHHSIITRKTVFYDPMDVNSLHYMYF